jgi:ribonuclease Z
MLLIGHARVKKVGRSRVCYNTATFKLWRFIHDEPLIERDNMSVRELVILGTAAQVPTRERNHNGYFLRWDNEGILFDPGEGTQRQMTYADISASSISRIALTHFHGDHCLGIPGVVQRLSLDKTPHRVHAYFPASGECFWNAMTHASLFQNVVDIEKHPITEPGVLYENDKIRLICAPLVHRTECYGYRLEELSTRSICMDRLSVYGISGPDVGRLKKQGYLDTPKGRIELSDVSVERQGQSFAHVMDTRPCDNARMLARNVDILLCEATYCESEAKQAHEYMHLTARQAAEIARDSHVGKLVLTHFSQRYLTLNTLLQEAREVFPNTQLAHDCQHIPFPKRKRGMGE